MDQLTPQLQKTSQVLNWLIKHATMVLAIIFTFVTVIVLMHLNKLSNEQIRDTALKNARLYSETLATFRSLYTSEVVIVAKKSGLTISHDYANKDNTIPLPATLSMMLGNKLGGIGSEVTSRLYSKYPFPWRENSGGLNDEFTKAAWLALRANPKQPFFRFETVNGRESLRYATADIMREDCVNCHNFHPDTPKNDWKAGDVRGVLEVITPIEKSIISANNMLKQVFYILVIILLLTLLGVRLVLSKLHQRTDEAQQLASDVSNSNIALQQEVEIRQRAEYKLREISLTDALTGIANRRCFDQNLKREWRRAKRAKTSLSVILLDVDDFKSYNDNYGHQQGDVTLRTLADTLNSASQRSSDLLCRFGGEEFILLLPETDISGAIQVAENIRKCVEDQAISHDFARAATVVTISAGAAEFKPGTDATPQSLIKRADDALYRAKKSGRNCVMPSSASNDKPDSLNQVSLHQDI